MTNEQVIDELLKRMRREVASDYHIQLPGWILHPDKFKSLMSEVLQHADITLKPLPDPCEAAFQEAIHGCERNIDASRIRIFGVWVPVFDLERFWKQAYTAAKERAT